MTEDRRTGSTRWDGAGRLPHDELAVETYRVLDRDGSPVDADAVPDLSADEHRDLFRWLLFERLLADRMVNLQRRGQLGTYPSGRGQEASIVGAAYAASRDDWLFGYGRESTAALMHGLAVRDLVLYWRGVEDAGGMSGANIFPPAISIGSHIPLAVGIAWGMSLSGTETVALVTHGDGATSTGAWHEGVNLAGVLGAPAVFYCQNNQYAISLPFEKQTNADSVTQRAPGYGIDGVRVDGNDVLAVYDAVSAARERALSGMPVLVESVTYRRGAHTTSDDPSRYRPDEEGDEWPGGDPLDRYRSFLEREGYWDAVDEEALREEIHGEIDEGIAAADAAEERNVEELFAYVHAEMPPDLRRQFEAFREFLEEHPESYEYIEQRPKG